MDVFILPWIEEMALGKRGHLISRYNVRLYYKELAIKMLLQPEVL